MNPPIKHRYFNPRHHIPTFSIAMMKAIFEPLMMYFILAGNLGLVVGAGLFYHLERDLNEAVNTFFDAYWWAVSTITTVGYGDVVPVTFLGKLTGIALMIGGGHSLCRIHRGFCLDRRWAHLRGGYARAKLRNSQTTRNN
jgi:hypothetical protein